MSSGAPRYRISDLLRVMERLRDPETGCPWDVAQTFGTIVSSTLEECYELVAAIEQEDFPHVAEELGDVLFPVVFYAQLAREQNLFSFEDIVHTLVDKLLRRHPHVFNDGAIEAVVVEAVSVDPVDTTGAGDMYAAGVLYGINNGMTWKQAGHLASHAAGRIVTQLGARLKNRFTPKDIEELLS